MLNHRLQIAEYIVLAASVLGWVVAIASGKLIYAAVPVSIALVLNLINHLRLEQRIRRRINTAIAQLHQELSQESYPLDERKLHETIKTYLVQMAIPNAQSRDENIADMNTQLASLEQSLNQVVQFINGSPLPAKVEHLENAIATATTQLTQIQHQLTNNWQSRIDEMERQLQVIYNQDTQSHHIQSVTQPSLVPSIPESKSVARSSVPSPLPTWSPLHTLKGHSDWVSSLAITPDGETLISGSFDKSIKLWNLSTGTIIDTLSEHSKGVLTVTVSPNGQILGSGSFDETIKLWNLSTGKLIHTLKSHTGSVRSLAITPDNQTLISGSFDEMIKLWHLDTGVFLGDLAKYVEQVSAIALTSDGLTLISGCGDGLITLRQLSSIGKSLEAISTYTLKSNLSSIDSLAITPDSKVLAAGCADGTIKLWSLSTLEKLSVLAAHSGPVMSVVFSVDGQTLISGGADGTSKVWHLETGQQLAVLADDSGASITAVAISPDNQMIAVGGANSLVKIWQLD